MKEYSNKVMFVHTRSTNKKANLMNFDYVLHVAASNFVFGRKAGDMHKSPLIDSKTSFIPELRRVGIIMFTTSRIC